MVRGLRVLLWLINGSVASGFGYKSGGSGLRFEIYAWHLGFRV